jgi:hypothetical protein
MTWSSGWHYWEVVKFRVWSANGRLHIIESCGFKVGSGSSLPFVHIPSCVLCAHLFQGKWWGDTAIATCGWWPRMYWVLSMDILSYGRCFCCVQKTASCTQACLFAFPPPLVGVTLEHKHGSYRIL